MIRVTVLKVPPGGVGVLVEYFAGPTAAVPPGLGGPDRVVGYYDDAGEPPGRWWGAGCDAVGLAGEVEPADLARMLEAAHPHTGLRLGRGYSEVSVRGYDATFSAPKSVSLLWALSSDENVRGEVLAAHDTAVEATLGWFEDQGCVTRRGTDGVDQVDTGGVCVALFRHHTSRTDDPQLHTHAVIWAKVQDPTGRWLALDARFLLGQQRTLSWVYDAVLRVELSRRLGLAWDPVEPGAGQAELAGVPEQLRDLFSQRTAQVDTKLAELVERWVDEHDGVEPDARTIAELQRRAVRASRPPKRHDGPATRGLHRRWRDEARAAGFDPDHLSVRRAQGRGGLERLERAGIVDEALARVSEQGSTWLRADLAREIAALIPPVAAPDHAGLVELVDDLADEALGQCVELHPPPYAGVPQRGDGRPVSEHVTDRHLSTTAILGQEQHLVRWAQQHLEPAPQLDGPDRPAGVANAVAGHGTLVLVVGPAGAGKTTAIRAGVARLHTQGRPVLGLAPSGNAADVLAEVAGCPAVTLSKVLHDDHTGRPLPPPGTTIVLDEAAMASTDDLDHLTTLAQTQRWRLVAVGDPDQLPAVGRGGMFAHWCDLLPAHRLEDIHRFDQPWEAAASLALRRGDPGAAATYTAHRRVHTAHPALLARSVANRWRTLTRSGATVAITTTTAATARAINTAIQFQHHLGERPEPAVRLADGTQVQVRDRIATRRNHPHLTTDRDVAVRNRHTWDVGAIDPDGAVVAHHPDRGTIRLPADYVTAHVELGWAVTGYGTQGLTVDHGLCIIEPGSTRAGIYVGLTRGRATNHAILLDPTGIADPGDTLAAAIARPPNATTALATRARLHRAHGHPAPDLELPAPGLPEQSLEPDQPSVSEPDRRPDPPDPAPPDPVPLDSDHYLARRLELLQRRPPPTRSLGR